MYNFDKKRIFSLKVEHTKRKLFFTLLIIIKIQIKLSNLYN